MTQVWFAPFGGDFAQLCVGKGKAKITQIWNQDYCFCQFLWYKILSAMLILTFMALVGSKSPEILPGGSHISWLWHITDFTSSNDLLFPKACQSNSDSHSNKQQPPWQKYMKKSGLNTEPCDTSLGSISQFYRLCPLEVHREESVKKNRSQFLLLNGYE